MTKEELKKKIVEVVNQWHMFQNRDMNGHTIWLTNDSEKLADALIEAGIGDVAELADKWREMLNTQAEKTLEAEHRLKVAVEWKEKVIKEIEDIEAENAALRERLEKSVERLKAREKSVCFGREWEAVVTDEDIDEVFGIAEARLAELKGE